MDWKFIRILKFTEIFRSKLDSIIRQMNVSIRQII